MVRERQMQDRNAKSAVGPGDAPNVWATSEKLRGTKLAPLIPPRRVRRAAYFALPRSERPIWAHISLGRVTHLRNPEVVRPYVPQTPTRVGDFTNLALAEIKRSVKRRRWAYYVSLAR